MYCWFLFTIGFEYICLFLRKPTNRNTQTINNQAWNISKGIIVYIF